MNEEYNNDSADQDVTHFVPDRQSASAAAVWGQEMHDEFLAAYLAGFARRQRRDGLRRQNMADELEDACFKFGKRCTGCLSSCCVTDTAVRRVAVTVVSVFSAVSLEVPVFYCSSCRAYTHVSPLELGYFPGTFDHAVRLQKARAGRPVIWFDIELLRIIASLQVSCPRISADVPFVPFPT